MAMKIFNTDKISTGVMLTLGLEALSALLLWAVLAILGEPMGGHIRLMAVCFVAPILLLRFYAKKKGNPAVTKSIIVTLFLTFVVFMFVVIKSGELTL